MKTTSYMKKNIRNQLNQAPETHWETGCSEKEDPRKRGPKTPHHPFFFFSYFILFGLEFADDLKLTIILLFVIFFIHFLNLLKFIDCLSPSLLGGELVWRQSSSSFKSWEIHEKWHHFGVSSVCVSAISCCSVYRWQLPKASFLLVFERFWRNHLRRMSTNEYPLFSLWLKMLIWNKTPENEDPPLLFALFFFCNNRSSSPFRRSYFLFVWRL